MTENIDITTTATLRPGLLKRTLESFCKNLFTDRKRYRLIINIDPIGEKCQPLDVVDITKKFFSDVVYNIPEEPSFPKAWKWCWDQVTADFVFHLEEDWELMRCIDIDIMIKLLEKNQNLACLRLLKMDTPSNLKFFGSKYVIKDGFLQAGDRSVSFGGNPQLIKSEFVKQVSKYMVVDRNPEKQFRKGTVKLWKNVTSKWDYGVYAMPKDKALIRDMGRVWMGKHGYRKQGGPEFTKWEKI